VTKLNETRARLQLGAAVLLLEEVVAQLHDRLDHCVYNPYRA
jgi:hypothetical protein